MRTCSCSSDIDVESQNAQLRCELEENSSLCMTLCIVGIEIVLRLLLSTLSTLLTNSLKLSVVVVDCEVLLREQQVTENTLLLLQLLVNSSHTTSQIAFLRRQIVALFASKTNPLVNRSNVLSKSGSTSERCVTFQAAMHELHVKRLEMIIHPTWISVRLVAVFTFDSSKRGKINRHFQR
jgi:hypothetical protein